MSTIAAGLIVTPGISAATIRNINDGTRVLTIDGVSNFRDIGGYTTADGRSVKWKTVFRSGELSAITSAGLTALTALGLHLVVDLRSPTEQQSAPDHLPSGVAELLAPVDNDVNAARRTSVSAAAADPATIAEYRSYVSNAASRTSFAKTFAALSSGSTLPMLWHCNAGASRTGWTTAILLNVLGVSKDQIYQDFLLTNQVLGGQYLFNDYLDAAFDQANKSFGSFDGYLQNIGVNASTIAQLKTRLLN